MKYDVDGKNFIDKNLLISDTITKLFPASDEG
jgi:hypothetical protein